MNGSLNEANNFRRSGIRFILHLFTVLLAIFVTNLLKYKINNRFISHSSKISYNIWSEYCFNFVNCVEIYWNFRETGSVVDDRHSGRLKISRSKDHIEAVLGWIFENHIFTSMGLLTAKISAIGVLRTHMWWSQNKWIHRVTVSCGFCTESVIRPNYFQNDAP